MNYWNFLNFLSASKIRHRSGYNTHKHNKTHTLEEGVSGWMVRWGVHWSVGLHPRLSHPSSTVCASLLWPQHCEFDECSTSALLNHWDSVWEAPLPESNGRCSTPLTHNHTYTQTLSTSLWRHNWTLAYLYMCTQQCGEDKQCIRSQT